jgi:hypothetical protein
MTDEQPCAYCAEPTTFATEVQPARQGAGSSDFFSAKFATATRGLLGGPASTNCCLAAASRKIANKARHADAEGHPEHRPSIPNRGGRSGLEALGAYGPDASVSFLKPPHTID